MPRFIDADNIKYTPAVSDGFYSNENHKVSGDFTVSGEFTVSMFASKDQIDTIPTADVEPVRHAHWVIRTRRSPYCSGCNEAGDGAYYCSHCGAKMDEEGEQIMKDTPRHRLYRPTCFGKYDTELLKSAREKLFNVYNGTYVSSDRKTQLLGTIINKLDRLLEEYKERK